MCTLIVLYRFLPSFPIIALHNRYAPIDSSETPPKLFQGNFKFYAPTDSHSKGTWIGFNEKGLFAAITDQHTEIKFTPYRSRGLALLDILASFSKASEALNYLKKELPKGYRRGNFILMDFEEAFHIIYDERLEIETLNPGTHVFTNLTIKEWINIENIPRDLLKGIEIRKRRALELVADLKPMNLEQLIEKLKFIASDHGDEPGRSSICYHSDADWYMSSSTIMAIANNLKDSKVFYCQGNPCKNKFIDYSHELFGSSITELSTKSRKLSSRRIALCLTGSVASIEAPKLARELRRHGAEVTCYMTQASIDYGVSPYVMEWATKRPVISKLTGITEHLMDYDLVIVYPATLNTINKIAQGLADNAVTTLCASTDPTRLLIAPAMNLRLYKNAILKTSVEKLAKMGATFVEPRLSEGAAKVATVDATVDYAIRCLSISKLKGRGVLILTGPTRYDLDPIRYISNKSTGKLGYWLAKEAFHRGCKVKVIYGPCSVSFPSYIPSMNAYTTEDMLAATLKELEKEKYEVAIFSAAVLDFKPSTYSMEKVKSGSSWHIELEPTVKIIEEVSCRYPDLKIVGFKLEYKVSREELIKRAQEELMKIRAFLIVANDLSEIEEESHPAYLINQKGDIKEFKGTKMELAREIFDEIEEGVIHCFM
jgi:phosphopantothenoylcysteine decarboxylase/phosphopantothenate--cysteine ligase